MGALLLRDSGPEDSGFVVDGQQLWGAGGAPAGRFHPADIFTELEGLEPMQRRTDRLHRQPLAHLPPSRQPGSGQTLHRRTRKHPDRCTDCDAGPAVLLTAPDTRASATLSLEAEDSEGREEGGSQAASPEEARATSVSGSQMRQSSHDAWSRPGWLTSGVLLLLGCGTARIRTNLLE